MEPAMGKKNETKSKIVRYVMKQHVTSKAELSRELRLSMPTILSNVKELLDHKILVEVGEYASTGGRKAVSIGINRNFACAMGLAITGNHLAMVLIDLECNLIKLERIRLKFCPEASYYSQVAEAVRKFLENTEQYGPLLGVGVSIPGILDQENGIVKKSHALKLEQYSLHMLRQQLPQPVFFENDANAALQAEDVETYQNAVYLFLNHTLGGAFCIGGKLCSGDNQKAGEFGHMVLVPGGRSCYCGKRGCADAYCAASVLTKKNEISVEEFMKRLRKGDAKAAEKWDTYLDNLAILISNLRMAYDMDLILGGEVGRYLSDSWMQLCEKVQAYNDFDGDVSYLKPCVDKKEASAVGAARHFVQEFVDEIGKYA